MPSLTALLWPFIDAILMVLVLIGLTRAVGLRSFSKMSGYDFAITVAMGSVLASVIVTKSTGPLVGAAALVATSARNTKNAEFPRFLASRRVGLTTQPSSSSGRRQFG